MNMLETLYETLDYYGENNDLRGIKRETYHTQDPDYPGKMEEKVTKSCQYVVTNGEKKFCAVGRCMLEELWDWAVDVSGSVEDLISEYWTHHLGEEEDIRDVSEQTLMNEMMMPEHQHPVRFWSSLQELHDTDTAWSCIPGVWLTHQGEEFLEQVLDVIRDSEPDLLHDCSNLVVKLKKENRIETNHLQE